MAAIYKVARTCARPPHTIRFPCSVPLSQLSGATPTSAAICLFVNVPNSGKFSSTVVVSTARRRAHCAAGHLSLARRDCPESTAPVPCRYGFAHGRIQRGRESFLTAWSTAASLSDTPVPPLCRGCPLALFSGRGVGRRKERRQPPEFLSRETGATGGTSETRDWFIWSVWLILECAHRTKAGSSGLSRLSGWSDRKFIQKNQTDQKDQPTRQTNPGALREHRDRSSYPISFFSLLIRINNIRL